MKNRTVKQQRIRSSPVHEGRRTFSLAEMIAECDPNAPPPTDLAAWDMAMPVGREFSCTIPSERARRRAVTPKRDGN